MVCLSQLVSAEAVLLDVTDPTRTELLETMLDCLVQLGRIADPECVATALVEREAVMSTGIGHGVAIPHAQCAGADCLTVALARLGTPIDFDAIDERPVRLVFLVVGPVQRGGFLQLLARISRLLSDEQLQADLLEAKDSQRVVELIEERERLLDAGSV